MCFSFFEVVLFTREDWERSLTAEYTYKQRGGGEIEGRMSGGEDRRKEVLL